jgi:amino acid transporter
MPAFFERLRADGSTPWAATLAMSAMNLILLALALGTTTIGGALTNAASSLGLISIVFYGITAAAALRRQWATLRNGGADLILGGLFPLIGVLFSIWVLIGSLVTGAISGPIMAYGLGSIAVGGGAALVLRLKGARFFAAR